MPWAGCLDHNANQLLTHRTSVFALEVEDLRPWWLVGAALSRKGFRLIQMCITGCGPELIVVRLQGSQFIWELQPVNQEGLPGPGIANHAKRRDEDTFTLEGSCSEGSKHKTNTRGGAGEHLLSADRSTPLPPFIPRESSSAVHTSLHRIYSLSTPNLPAWGTRLFEDASRDGWSARAGFHPLA